MILSFHPIIEADENIICAGRQPDEHDLSAIRRAQAVILPQGCSEALYRMARSHCPHVFPNLDIRFDYPGKIGQIRLFRKLELQHPRTELYEDLLDLERRPPPIPLPVVVKLNYGGQGDTVFQADTPAEFKKVLEKIEACERTGQKGFLIQQFISTRDCSLRIAVIHRRMVPYWRIAPGRFGTSVAQGAHIDHEADPHLREAAAQVVHNVCGRTGLQLAGFDFIFNAEALDAGRIEPLALEINYFFGRTGLGGSQKYYRILEQQVDAWLSEIGLHRRFKKV
jgi:ribosomal protein S6--L-glutamate ligase